MKKILLSSFFLLAMSIINILFVPTTVKASHSLVHNCNLAIMRINEIVPDFNAALYTRKSDSMMYVNNMMGCGRPPNSDLSVFMMLEPTRYFVSDKHIQAYSNDELRDMSGYCIYQATKQVVKTRMHSGCK